MLTRPRKLHLGCGYTALDDFINIDIVPGCDLKLDLSREPLPFEDNSIECVFSFHALEHLENYLFALQEIWRVLRHGGRLLVQVPYVTLSEYNLVNPYHRHHFNEFSFDFFDPAKLRNSANEGTEIHFQKVWHRFHYLPEFEAMPETERSFCRRHYFNVVRAIDFGVIAVKPPHATAEISDDTAERMRAELDDCVARRRVVDRNQAPARCIETRAVSGQKIDLDSERDGFRRAVVHVAWGERWISEAVDSAHSAAILGVDRILITDAASRVHLPATAPFERIIEHEFSLGGNLAKSEMFDCLPAEYDSFVYLDTDTRVLLDITQGFERAERHGIAIAQAANYSLEHFWGFGEVLERMSFVSNELLLYNSGVIFFTRTPEVWQVMQRYHELCRNSDGSFDQPYLTLAMEQLGFNPYTLSIAYNYRNFGEIISGRVRIWHSHLPVPTDINEFEQPWPPRRYRHGMRLEDSG